jgi:hypothetical protein
MNAEAHYGTRWGVMAKAFVPALAVVVAIATAMVRGVLATSFVAEGGTLRLTTSQVKGDGVAILLENVPKGSGTSNGYDARVAIQHAEIDGLCATQTVGILGVHWTLKVTVGGSAPLSGEHTADNLLMDARSADGQIFLSGHSEVNKNAASVVAGTSGMQLDGASDGFGIQAEHATLTQVTAIVHDIQIPGALNERDLHISVEQGDDACPSPAAP